MRVYTIGLPIEDTTDNLIMGPRPRHISKEELIKSLTSDEMKRIFLTYDEAQDYVQSLNHREYILSLTRKTIDSSKARPIFTLALPADLNLGNLKKEQVTFDERFINAERQWDKRSVTKEVNYYEIPTRSIAIDAIIRCEFFQSILKPIEFNETNAKCLVQ